MTLPTHITNGFHLDEAIAMIDLCRRTHELFTHAPTVVAPPGQSAVVTDWRAPYGALYQDKWHYVHAFSDAASGLQVLLTKKANQQQYAIAFVGPPAANPTHRASTDRSGQPLVQEIAITRGDSGAPPAAATAQTSEYLGALTTGMPTTHESVLYPPLAAEQETPPAGARVHGPWYAIFARVQRDIEIFFDILVNPKFARPLLLDLIHGKPEEKPAKMAAIGAAITVRHNQASGAQVVQVLSETLQQISSGQKEPSSVALDEIIAQTIGEQPIMADLTAGLDLYSTGHGVGGCLAALCALQLKRKWETRIDFPNFAIKMYNFGSPKIGNRAFVDYYNQLMGGYSYRIQNLLDGATYEPQSQAPFPYNLQLLLPGTDYVRQGETYYLVYAHIDEARLFSGWGKTSFTFNFMGANRPFLPLPFAHNPEGYQELLIDARDHQAPLQKLLPPFVEQFSEQSYRLYAKWQERGLKLQQLMQQWQGPPRA